MIQKEFAAKMDFFGALRMMVLGSLLHIKYGGLPRGVRKVEMILAENDLDDLKRTIPSYDKQSLVASLKSSVTLYQIKKLTF